MDEYFRKKIPFEVTALAINSTSMVAAGGRKICLFYKDQRNFVHFGNFEDEVEQMVTALEFVPQSQLLLVGFESGVLKVMENNLVKHIWNKGHEGHKISSITAHSSGKLALTFSPSSGIMKTWSIETKYETLRLS
jgi:WD40 repeat protein